MIAPPPTDAETGSWCLVYAAQRGDREAFAELWRRYRPLVAGYVRCRVQGEALVEDITSETFLRAWRSIGSARDQGRDVSAWLVTIALNLIRDHVKSHRVQREAFLDDAVFVEPRDSAPSVERVVLARIDAAEMGERIAELIPDQRRVIGLRFGHDLTVSETAAAMGRSESAVKSLQHRVLTWLRKESAGGER